ncbi:MAG: PTS transporter subunit EIIC [Enterobacter hormaechei]
MPQFLGFFGGKRFVPIITAVAAIIVGYLLPWLWIPVQRSGVAFNAGGQWA